MIKWQYLLSENAKLEEYFKFSLFPLFSLQNKVSLLSACFLFFIIFFFPHHLSKKGHFASLFFLKLCIHTNTAFELRLSTARHSVNLHILATLGTPSHHETFSEMKLTLFQKLCYGI